MNKAGVVFACALMVACSSSSNAPSDPPSEVAGKNGPPSDYVFGGDRPVSVVRVPDNYDPAKAAPLVLLLHGYGANAATQSLFFNLASIADTEGFFVVAPEGTTDGTGKQFWNANELCCNFENKPVDDVAYLRSLVDDVEKYYNIDPKRIFVLGHSNGGAMALRMACDAADKFAAIVELAGPFTSDPSSCKPSAPIGVLHMHGTKDTTITYEPSMLASPLHPNAPGRSLPGALATVSAWAGHNGCAPEPETAAPIDLDGDVAGAETTISKYEGCTANGGVELWTMEGSGHVPLNLTKDLPKLLYGFMSSHAKP
ncbi:MAG: alpha/beta fold hydrolase [Labilithrix sp.]|nr:alpha/beta fold hydrolase [Labilithrix sp.]